MNSLIVAIHKAYFYSIYITYYSIAWSSGCVGPNLINFNCLSSVHIWIINSNSSTFSTLNRWFKIVPALIERWINLNMQIVRIIVFEDARKIKINQNFRRFRIRTYYQKSFFLKIHLSFPELILKNYGKSHHSTWRTQYPSNILRIFILRKITRCPTKHDSGKTTSTSSLIFVIICCIY